MRFIVRRQSLSRREFCVLAASGTGSLALGSACKRLDVSVFASDGRITARPREGVKTTVTGEIVLDLDQDRHAVLRLPQPTPQSSLPLFVMLHGATQSAEDMFWYLDSAPQDLGVAVIAPKSLDTTWDAIRGSFGTDVDFLNRALERVFETVSIDPARVSVGGFSDGASYGISLGLINADLFSSVVAFSPGFVIEGTPHSKPRIFISHGTNDHILPIDRCGRRIASGLKGSGYDVTFREFDGDHEIPADIVREGLKFIG